MTSEAPSGRHKLRSGSGLPTQHAKDNLTLKHRLAGAAVGRGVRERPTNKPVDDAKSCAVKPRGGRYPAGLPGGPLREPSRRGPGLSAGPNGGGMNKESGKVRPPLPGGLPGVGGRDSASRRCDPQQASGRQGGDIYGNQFTRVRA